MRLLITGGAGYIGSVAVEQAQAAGHDVTVLDNVWRGHAGAVPDDVELLQVDLRDRVEVAGAVKEARPEAIMHFAAATLVPESMREPLLYFAINTGGSINLLNAAIAADVERFIFSSTAAVYGATDADPITEETPTVPINPYGHSKLMTEHMLRWQSEIANLRVAVFRYFNVAGATELRGEDHDPETHIIPVALQAAAGKRDAFTIFGTDYPTPDGTAIRDYVHVADLADAHLLALDWLNENRWGVFNLGTKGGYSVQQVVDAVEAVVGQPLPVQRGPRREGDPPRLVADPSKAERELGWRPNRSTPEEMVGSAWRWMQAHPNGYEAR